MNDLCCIDVEDRNGDLMKTIKKNKNLIEQTCYRYSKLSPLVEMDDLRQEAMLGLIEAYRKITRSRSTMSEAKITTIITCRIKKFLGQLFKDENFVVVLESDDATEKTMSYAQFQKIKRKLPKTATHTVQKRVVSLNEGAEDWDDSTNRNPAEIILVG
jgi:DNA-directed RNA polymerase specialized sigma subunit